MGVDISLKAVLEPCLMPWHNIMNGVLFGTLLHGFPQLDEEAFAICVLVFEYQVRFLVALL